MIKYSIDIRHPHRQFIQFKAEFPHDSGDILNLQLPAWRPGRYELGNFAKYIRQWKVMDAHGNVLEAEKVTKDLWQIQAAGLDKVVIEYDFHANILNAGSSWLHVDQLYINPVNCFFYVPEHQDLGYEVTLNIPENWQVACGLEQNGRNTLIASDVQQMMDCPIIASDTLVDHPYEVNGVTYHIWIQGEIHFDIERFVSDHRAFTVAMLEAFETIPCEEYHFMYQFPGFKARHGVEHSNSTVIAWGPAQLMADEKNYREVIGISCHELYHTWNIKNIRPAEMMPYNFEKENYSRLGYVAEGVTTYYGDQFLLRCGVFDRDEYLNRLAAAVMRHAQNFGRFNLSVADSSFDTWLDGYVPGVPGRKVSIYNEGTLTALMTDLEIIVRTSGEKSLDDVMRILYEEFGKKGIGYTEKDYRKVVARIAGADLTQIFDDFIYGMGDYLPRLSELMSKIGLEVIIGESKDIPKALLGFTTNSAGMITSIWPDSPADDAGLALGDQILSINGVQLAEITLQEGDTAEIAFVRFGKEQQVSATARIGLMYPDFGIVKHSFSDVSKEALYNCWLRTSPKYC